MADGEGARTPPPGTLVRVRLAPEPGAPGPAAKGASFEGVVMRRPGHAPPGVVVVKLPSGYNLAIPAGSIASVEELGTRGRPRGQAIPATPAGLPKVVLVSTGGTIASFVDYATGAVHPAVTASDLVAAHPELATVASIECVSHSSLLSENVEPSHWTELASLVADAFGSGAKGVVVAHGTDTMAYTANALSLALPALPGPVVLTGAQRSADRPSSDAHLNLLASARVAASGACGEVLVAMHASSGDDAVAFHRARHASKRHSSKRDAFVSVGSRPAFTVSGETIAVVSGASPPTPGRPRVEGRFEPSVKVVWSHPGISADDVSRALEGARGAVLLGTGLGHFPARTLPALEAAANRGCLLVMSSQCADGAVNMNVYSSGRELLRAGVLPSREPTVESTVVRLMWALGTARNLDEAKAAMGHLEAGKR